MNVDKKEESRPSVDEEATEAAATALTALSISSNVDGEDGDESFAIPERFTKSGRKRATPFPLKVRKSVCEVDHGITHDSPWSLYVLHVLTIMALFVYVIS